MATFRFCFAYTSRSDEEAASKHASHNYAFALFISILQTAVYIFSVAGRR